MSFWEVVSLVPLLAMVVFGVGIFAEPSSINTFLDEISSAVPGDTAEMLTEQARTWSSASARWSTFWLVVAALVASWGACAGVSQLIRAINARHERPRRSFAVRRLGALARTITALVIIIPAVILIGATPAVAGPAESHDVKP